MKFSSTQFTKYPYQHSVLNRQFQKSVVFHMYTTGKMLLLDNLRGYNL
jgi:hypothetical protein